MSACATKPRARILFQSLAPNGGDTLYTMNEDGSNIRRLELKVPGSAISPDWSPDGKRVAFAVALGESQSIWVAEASGKNAKELFHCADACLGADYPAWSPDGRFVAFTYANANPPQSGPPSGTSIRIIDVATRKVRMVVQSKLPQLIDLARWSPDGTRLVAERDRFSPAGDETGCRIEVVRLRDGHIRPLTAFARFAFHPDWNPNGGLLTFDTYDLLAFQDYAPGSSNLFTIRPDGTHLRQLTHFRPGGNRVSAATFTPDGKRIVFTYQVGNRRRAGVIASNGSAIKVVPAPYDGPITHPRLAPGS